MDENEKKAKEDRRKKRKEYVEKIKARPELLLLCPLIWPSDPAFYAATLLHISGNLYEGGEDHRTQSLAGCAGCSA